MDRRDGEQGFMLLVMVVAIFLVMLALSVAAPRMARELRREREVEAVHRGNQYVRAIRKYYQKNGNLYPGSIEQLEKTNNVRFLRQKYVDPMTGKADWRLIHVGEAKTTVKGFFGQPLTGLPGSGAATGAGATSPAAGTAGAASTSAFGSSPSAFGSSPSAFGSSSTSGSGSAFGASSTSGTSAFGSSGSSAAGASGTGTGMAAGAGTGWVFYRADCRDVPEESGHALFP